MLPVPGVLRSWISPPSRFESSRLIARPRPVPPYLRLVLASACWKASKISFCFSAGMPMPVSDTSNATTAGAWLRIGWFGLQPSYTDEIRNRTSPWLVNLNALESRFLSTCCRRLASVSMRAVEMRIDLDLEVQVAGIGFVPERPRHRLDDALEHDLFGLDRDRARLDLGKIENVADEVEQVGTRAVNGARELDLLRRQIVIRVFRELMAEDQDRIQRRAQLVRHVGEELGLVLGREREFGRLFFHRAPGLFDFLVLALHLDVLLGKLAGLLFELFVGLLQFLLLGLKLGGELLRLLEQTLRSASSLRSSSARYRCWPSIARGTRSAIP